MLVKFDTIFSFTLRISISFYLSPLLRSVSITVELWVASDQHFPESLFLVKNYTQDVCLAGALQGGDYCIIFQFSGHNSSFRADLIYLILLRKIMLFKEGVGLFSIQCFLQMFL